MAVTYFKRYRMELGLNEAHWAGLGQLQLPEGFMALAWTPKLLNMHAEVKWASFRNEIDAHVFPCLSDREGCRHLMREIVNRKNFIPEATWLICRHTDFAKSPQPCGTIQGLRHGPREGAVQNLGVHPDCRDLGLGRALLHLALDGFRRANCRHAQLEVTVENQAAIRLYERFGFRRVETLFKVADVLLA